MRCLIIGLAFVFAGTAQAVTIETVPVGHPGNAGEWSGSIAGGYGGNRICGAVDYAYNIGKYEVTAGQYAEFLNAVAATDTYGLYNGAMWGDPYGCKIQQSGSSGNYSYSVALAAANRPVNFVSWYDSLRFANWLHNDQPGFLGYDGNGAPIFDPVPQDLNSTEDGAYDMSLGANAVRKPAAMVFLPSEDEWYKAAYYDPEKSDVGGYWEYPTGSESVPGRDMNEITNSGNNVNYTSPFPIDPPYLTTIVGEFELSDSPYGTFDQGGNVWERTETTKQGGSATYGSAYLRAAYRGPHISLSPDSENNIYGFRVASVPEPHSILTLFIGVFVLLVFKRRR